MVATALRLGIICGRPAPPKLRRRRVTQGSSRLATLGLWDGIPLGFADGASSDRFLRIVRVRLKNVAEGEGQVGFLLFRWKFFHTRLLCHPNGAAKVGAPGPTLGHRGTNHQPNAVVANVARDDRTGMAATALRLEIICGR